MSEGILKNVLHTKYFDNGLKRQEGSTFNGNKEGKWITWNENGQKISERVYKKGEKI